MNNRGIAFIVGVMGIGIGFQWSWYWIVAGGFVLVITAVFDAWIEAVR